ncbi:MAG: hypothetical protein AB7F88_00200 [Pyrinomonadaceae bacterium]
MKLIQNILVTGLIAGSLDIVAAIFILAGGDAAGILKYVASGVFGPAALKGESQMVAYGLIFHFAIAMSWTALYFLLYPKLGFVRWNKWISGVVYGVLVWMAMNLVVLPLSKVPRGPLTWTSVLTNVLILTVCIGTPIAVLADRHYATREDLE